MKRFFALLLIAALLLGGLAACSSVTQLTPEPSDEQPYFKDDPTANPSSDPSGSTQLTPDPDVDVDPIGGAVELGGLQTPSGAAFSDLGLRLLAEAREDGENSLVSPLSIVYALAMAQNGASEATLEQMQSVLGMSRDELNEFLADYIDSLPDDEKCKLSVANSIWFRDTDKLAVEQFFLAVCEEYFGSELYKAPFDSSTVREINAWCDEHTDGMIKEIINEIGPNTMLYLINALAFDAEWRKPYDEYQVRDEVFTREDGSQTDVELMYSTENIYLEDDYATGLVKLYAGGRYAFAALLPKEGVSVDAYLDWLNGGQIASLLENRQNHEVRAAIPKFKAEFSAELSRTLSALGMSDAFDPTLADFSAMGSVEGENLYIGAVLHKTFIEVDELGTKAGAVTAIAVEATGAIIDPPEPKEVYLDRPFVYMLVDLEQNLPFFIGTVENIGEANGSSVDPLITDENRVELLPLTTLIAGSGDAPAIDPGYINPAVVPSDIPTGEPVVEDVPPGRIDADGGSDEELCSLPTAVYAAHEWRTEAVIADFVDGSCSIEVELPEGWVAEVASDENASTLLTLAVRPEGASGSIDFNIYKNFGVCGTGLVVADIAFWDGRGASVGYYDGSDIWSYVSYDDGSDSFDFVALNSGADEWIAENEELVWEILGRAKVSGSFE